MAEPQRREAAKLSSPVALLWLSFPGIQTLAGIKSQLNPRTKL